MHKVEVTQINKLGRSGDNKNKWRRVSVNLELDYIPQIGSFFESEPYLGGKVREVWHKHYTKYNQNFHEVILDNFGDWASFSSTINWDDLPDNVSVGPILLKLPDGTFIEPENLDQ